VIRGSGDSACARRLGTWQGFSESLQQHQNPGDERLFLARVHLFSCRSRLRAATRVSCASDQAKVMGRRLAVNPRAPGLMPLQAMLKIGCLADVQDVASTAQDVHEVHDDDDGIVGWRNGSVSQGIRFVRGAAESNGGGGGSRT
jgi:hypothetical protein